MIFNMAGGGAPLNFKVEAYASELLLPASAKENTVAVITETPITGWAFSATEPEAPAEGMVWVQTGSDSVAPFNALKKNMLMAYPMRVYQYAAEAWTIKTAKTFVSGAWTDWGSVIFGGASDFDKWTATTRGTGGTISLTNDIMVIHANATNSAGSHGALNVSFTDTDLTPYSTIKATFGTVVGKLIYYGVGIKTDPAYSHGYDTGSNWSAINYEKLETGSTSGVINPEISTLECSIESINTGYPALWIMGSNVDVEVLKVELF